MKTAVAGLNLLCVSLIVISLMLTGQSFAKITPESIVAIWLFDEDVGKVVKDSSGNGNDAEIKGSRNLLMASLAKV